MSPTEQRKGRWILVDSASTEGSKMEPEQTGVQRRDLPEIRLEDTKHPSTLWLWSKEWHQPHIDFVPREAMWP